jgi:hypothetical protein
MNKTDEYVKAGIAAKTIKLCPHCERPGELASGCNYIKCPAKDCKKEWCWVCEKPKYKSIAAKPALGFCNNKSHNSH